MTSHQNSMIGFGTKILGSLEEASYSTTYKFALLLSLIDRAREGVTPHGRAPTSLSPTSVAERVLQLYWPQTSPFSGSNEAAVLRQSGRGKAAIVKRLADFRAHHGLSSTAPAPGLRVLTGYDRLLADVEWTVAQMPLPRLQRPYDPFIYAIDWDETISRSNYFGKERIIGLIGHSGDNLVRLEPLLRPVIERHWGLMVGALNRDLTDEARLHRFLFEPRRIPPRKLLNDLTELQAGTCFYCRESMSARHIDHFIPWSHSLDEGIDNLVLSCRTCNLSKSSHRATAELVEHWAQRFTPGRQSHLASVASTHGWERDPNRTLGLARSTYVGLPDGTKLWRSMNSFTEIAAERPRITEVLAIQAG